MSLSQIAISYENQALRAKTQFVISSEVEKS
jgi:hypothetical protein